MRLDGALAPFSSIPKIRIGENRKPSPRRADFRIGGLDLIALRVITPQSMVPSRIYDRFQTVAVLEVPAKPRHIEGGSARNNVKDA